MRLDIADYVCAAEDMTAYLGDWLADAPEVAAGISRALGDIARAKCMAQVAMALGLRLHADAA